MAKYTAIIIDVMSIQKYVFQSNKLGENIGASYIVEEIYNSILKESIEASIGPKSFDIDAWHTNPSVIQIESGAICELAYVGGGNALILFKNEGDKEKTNSRKFIEAFSKDVLVKAPGLKIAFGINPEFDLSSFQKSMEDLHANLLHRKNTHFLNVTIPKYGIIADCPYSGESAEQDYNKTEKMFLSASSQAKLSFADASLEKANKLIDNDKYTFTNDIGSLGQTKSKEYIAVVHVDGNGMGNKFMACKTLAELRNLSVNVKKNTNNTFIKLKDHLIDLIEHKSISKDNGFELNYYGGKCILPIRPLVVGGDDLSFISEGRLGVHLAEKVLEFFSADEIMGSSLSACAGVGIAHTKYPFYKVYSLAEELCQSAKAEAKKKDHASYLDYLISSGGFSGDLEDIREKHKVNTRSVNFGPYRTDKDRESDSIFHLKQGIKVMSNIPRTKVKALREYLSGSDSRLKAFIMDLQKKGHSLYEIRGKQYHENGWIDDRTPFFDIIDLIDFYPEELI